MNAARKLLTIIKGDKKLLMAFSGALIDGMILISVIVTGCFLFLT
jgi:hypothetical protein